MATTTMTTVALRSVRCGAGQDSPLASPSGSQCECSGRASSAQMRSVASPAPGKLRNAVAALPSPSSSSLAEGTSDDDFCFAAACAKLGLAGLAAAALVWTAVPAAVAYKGGGPYGIEVTRGQDLSGKDFSGRTLIKQDFKTSILRQANFKGAKLLGASFFDSDLTGADLTDADLRGVDFSLANVAKANLTNANLEGATVTGNTSFKGAIITGADFTDVLWRDDQRVQLCRSAGGVNSTTGNATRETLLCE